MASNYLLRRVCWLLTLSSSLLSWSLFCSAAAAAQKMSMNPKIKAVNLGGWLVTEGWIKPSLFDGIPNRDFLDGTQLQFKSVTTGKYLSAENGGGSTVVANRASASGWETFRIWRVDESTFNFVVFNRQFIGRTTLEGGDVIAKATTPLSWEEFSIVRNPSNPNLVRIKASNGLYWQARSETSVTADSRGDGSWGNGDPSVFSMSIIGQMRGEFQVTNGYGRDRAAAVMREHWNTFIVEDDFRFISQKGLNAVRIPVGWWIASDPSPPSPFVGGSLQILDKAFSWAEKYGLGVIIDLHAAPAAQNRDEHGGSRDGVLSWGEDNIPQTVSVIDFLASRYAKSPSLLAMELMNEPWAPDITVDTLSWFYRAGYDAVRKYTSTAYVIMSARLGPGADPKELLPHVRGLGRIVIDVHCYNLFEPKFDSMNVQDNINFINNDRAGLIRYVDVSNGPLLLIGEWVTEWKVPNASKEDFQKFARAQLDVFGTASFGWAYWTYKNVNDHWSLKWMIDNGYISL